jgi:type VI secretion system secreted protein VgrG
MNRRRTLGVALGLALLVLPCLAAGQPLSFFAVLGGSTVTNTATPTVVTGNLGVSPGSTVTGFPPGIVTGGTIHAADAVAAQAQSDLTTEYNSLASAVCSTDLTGQDLGGKTLVPGVYCFSTSAQLTGALTLDAQGNSNAVFIFKIGSTLTTASASSVVLINGASSCGVFWQIGSSATLGTGTALAGSIVALTSITLNTGASVTGRVLARNGAVTLDDNQVTVCSGGAGLPPAVGAVPTLSGWAMIVLAGLLLWCALAAMRWRAAAPSSSGPQVSRAAAPSLGG